MRSLVFVALGSNQGDSRQSILRAMERLQQFSVAPLLKSSLWQTTPVDCPPDSPLFINAVAGLTALPGETPESLMEKLQALEKEFGRQRAGVANEPRTLDLDLIAFGNETRNTPQLVLPHPRAHQRRFVLQPLSEIAPGLILPGQTKTVAQFLAGFPSGDLDAPRWLQYSRTMFRPCIDLHEGKVKQIVGGTLGEAASALRTNFVSERSSIYYAELYKRDGLKGGHVIMLGPGNEDAARAALRAYPGGLQIGGGINADNAKSYLADGASHVIVTSWVFREGRVDWERLNNLVKAIGKDRLVLDLSCRKRGEDYVVVTDRWQKFTELMVNKENLEKLAGSCAEFLVHAVDVEGLCKGIDRELVKNLGQWSPIPTTYAGGANSLQDLEEVARLGQGKVDLTIGSALDIFGGTGVRYEDCVKFNRRKNVIPS